MALQITNSLTKTKEPFVPLDPSGKRVNMYTCGVTVYDKCHVGHARSLYIFDVIRQYLKYRGYDVHFIRNITDIDDKIINKANDLKISSEEVAEKNIEDYQQDLNRMDISQADMEPKATENIDEMIRYIEGLIGKGFAYEAQGDVYFQVRTFNEYGKLSGQSVDQMMEAVRIEKDIKKKDPLDFVLWKKSKEGEPSWPSPWGEGRPGWHIECSCMSLKHLGCETLDIHAGGRDLIFPHHENEIAQAEAFTGKPFAKYWIHHGLLTINKQKMAKSLGNFVTIEDAVEKFGADTLKMFFLSSHYASSVDFSEERMQDARKAWQRFEIFLGEAKRLSGEPAKVAEKPSYVQKREEEFEAAMDDDFNTPKAMSCLYELVSDTYKLKQDQDYSLNLISAADAIERIFQAVFGFFKKGFQLPADDSGEVEKLLEQRKAARENKDYQKSDDIRDQLLEIGIVVEDTPQGQVWRKA